jgi:hypothetical protein
MPKEFPQSARREGYGGIVLDTNVLRAEQEAFVHLASSADQPIAAEIPAAPLCRQGNRWQRDEDKARCAEISTHGSLHRQNR